MKGREAEWQQRLKSLDTAELVRALQALDYGAVVIDRFGYGDRATALEVELTEILGIPPGRKSRRAILVRHPRQPGDFPECSRRVSSSPPDGAHGALPRL